MLNALIVFYFYFEQNVEWYTLYTVLGFSLYLGSLFGSLGTQNFVQKRVLAFNIVDCQDLLEYKMIGVLLTVLVSLVLQFFYGIMAALVFGFSALTGLFDFVEYVIQAKGRMVKVYFLARLLLNVIFFSFKVYSGYTQNYIFLLISIFLELLSLVCLNVLMLKLEKVLPGRLDIRFRTLVTGNAWIGSWKFFLLSIAVLVYMKFDMFVLSSLPASGQISSYFFSLRIVEYGYMLFTIYLSVNVIDLNRLFNAEDNDLYFRKSRRIFSRVICLYVFSISTYLLFFSHLPIKLQLLKIDLLILSLNFLSLSFSALFGNYLYNLSSFSLMYRMNLIGLILGTILSTTMYFMLGVLGLAISNVIVQIVVGFGFAIFFDFHYLKRLLWLKYL